jgi:hypothetical protein
VDCAASRMTGDILQGSESPSSSVDAPSTCTCAQAIAPVAGTDHAACQLPLLSAAEAATHDFAADLQNICGGQSIPGDAVAVMKSLDGRNGYAKKTPYLAFLVPERGRYLWMRSWEAWGLRKCSLCGAITDLSSASRILVIQVQREGPMAGPI